MAQDDSAPAPAAVAIAPKDAGAEKTAAFSSTSLSTARPRNRIQVSREKRPLYFFIGLAKKFLVSEDEVELSGLGLAVTTVVTVAEILKNSGLITISRIATSLVEMDNEHRGSSLPKAKIQIWIRKTDKFHIAKPHKMEKKAVTKNAKIDGDRDVDIVSGKDEKAAVNGS